MSVAMSLLVDAVCTTAPPEDDSEAAQILNLLREHRQSPEPMHEDTTTADQHDDQDDDQNDAVPRPARRFQKSINPENIKGANSASHEAYRPPNLSHWPD